ncbi:hypothetical protein [Jatrophihabitans sp.]|uniref:hypothetical protein n=1 Tax=Jatrophihabitans sp. TaxID=1932789 RepID=UPI0030C69B95|nr:hypothetical protein [Jatrophihabitans sp.]
MPRARSRRLQWVAALVCLFSALVGVTSAAAASTPSPSSPASGTSTGAAAGGASKKPPTVTFGIGPANTKALDGRPSFSYASAPGAEISDHFAIVNISTQTLDLIVYGVDAVSSATGGLGYAARSAAKKAAGGWLAMPEHNGSDVFAVRGGSTLVLPFQLRIPANASPGDHTAGIAVGLLADVQGKNTKNLTFEQRVVAKVYVRVSGTPVAKLEVQHLHASYSGSLNPIGSGSVTVSYVVHNAGNVDLGAHLKLSVSGLFGGAGSVPKLADIPDLLPGASAKFSIKVPDVLPTFMLSGTVKVTPTALAGSVDPKLASASASTHFWAVPWALLVLIVVLAALAYGLRRYSRHRQATRPAPTHRRGRDGGTASVNPSEA